MSKSFPFKFSLFPCFVKSFVGQFAVFGNCNLMMVLIFLSKLFTNKKEHKKDVLETYNNSWWIVRKYYSFPLLFHFSPYMWMHQCGHVWAHSWQHTWSQGNGGHKIIEAGSKKHLSKFWWRLPFSMSENFFTMTWENDQGKNMLACQFGFQKPYWLLHMFKTNSSASSILLKS